MAITTAILGLTLLVLFGFIFIKGSTYGFPTILIFPIYLTLSILLYKFFQREQIKGDWDLIFYFLLLTIIMILFSYSSYFRFLPCEASPEPYKYACEMSDITDILGIIFIGLPNLLAAIFNFVIIVISINKLFKSRTI